MKSFGKLACSLFFGNRNRQLVACIQATRPLFQSRLVFILKRINRVFNLLDGKPALILAQNVTNKHAQERVTVLQRNLTGKLLFLLLRAEKDWWVLK